MISTTPALQTFTIKAKEIDALEPKKLAFSAISKAGGRNFFAIKFIMSEGHEENEGSVNEFDAHS